MYKLKSFIIVLIFTFSIADVVIAQELDINSDAEKGFLLDSLIFSDKSDSVVAAYSKYKKSCKAIDIIGDSLITQRMEFVRLFNKASFQDSLYAKDELLEKIDDELNDIYVRLVFLEGVSTGQAVIYEFPEVWKNACNCPAEIIYSDMLELMDSNTDSEYPFDGLEHHFQLIHKADSFFNFYPYHYYSSLVYTMYNETLLKLTDIHEVIYKRDTTRTYAIFGFENGSWPYRIYMDHYKDMLAKYPGTYSALLYSSVYNLSAFINGKKVVYILIEKTGSENDISKPDFKTYLHIQIENPKYKDYGVLKYHYNKEVLRSFSENTPERKIVKAVIKKPYIVRIIK